MRATGWQSPSRKKTKKKYSNDDREIENNRVIERVRKVVSDIVVIQII